MFIILKEHFTTLCSLDYRKVRVESRGWTDGLLG